MDNRDVPPAVETRYEDPPPMEQKKANVGITGMIALLAIAFAIVLVIAFVVMR